MKITLTLERLSELLEAAYEDGYEDGVNGMVESHELEEPNRNDATGRYTCPDDFGNSVTKDQLAALQERVRNGGKP